MSEKNNEILLEVKDLVVSFNGERGALVAVDGASFHVKKGETLGIAGESGCGKSISSMSIMRLVETPPGSYDGGEIIFDGKTLLRINENERFMISEDELRKIRGNDISYIFQEPMTSLNPVHRVGDQIAESMIIHRGMGKKEAFEEAVRLLETVRIPNARRVAREYPFSLSGGMRQRAMIAMSLACEPKLLIADEPTTALDVTIQAQVLGLMNDLKKRIDASIMFITHDLGVIAEMSDRVVIMYAGKIVETAPVEDLFGNPKHPYTQGLMFSRPDFETAKDRLNVIPGNVPDPSTRPVGCPFHPRCSKVKSICQEEYPPAHQVAEEHRVFCWEYDKAGEDRWKRAKENAMDSTLNEKEEAADE